MASFNIHLAVAKRYFEKNKTIQDENEFYRGAIAPDFEKDKRLSHYTGTIDKSNLIKYLNEKVSLIKYLKEHNIESDYQKGVFLHLITDYLFFNKFFDYSYLNSVTYEEFIKNLYYSYNINNEYLISKYSIDCDEFLEDMNNNISQNMKSKNVSNETGENILPIIYLDEFIEYVSNINLENYKNKILVEDKNIFP